LCFYQTLSSTNIKIFNYLKALIFLWQVTRLFIWFSDFIWSSVKFAVICLLIIEVRPIFDVSFIVSQFFSIKIPHFHGELKPNFVLIPNFLW